VVMISSAGTDAAAAAVIAEACNTRKVMTTALIIGSETGTVYAVPLQTIRTSHDT